MASKDPDTEPGNTRTEEETIAFKNKRARRVSFADREITSVHIFHRDDDFETPPHARSKSSSASNRRTTEDDGEKEVDADEVVRFFGDLAADSDDSKEVTPREHNDGSDYDDDDVSPRKSFFQPVDTPSPRSSTVGGSATSNDEENFFGPVSASFIRPGRLSDSAASDSNHDITMDSTAFSMHFRSLVMSESGELRTPGESHFFFGDKTPSQVGTPSDSRNFMLLTEAKKHGSQSTPHAFKVSRSRGSNDMSLVGEHSNRFNYGQLSPTTEAIIAKVGENGNGGSIFDMQSPKKSEGSIAQENGCGSMDLKDNGDAVICVDGLDDDSSNGVGVNSGIGKLNVSSSFSLSDGTAHDCASDGVDRQTVNTHVNHQIQSPNLLEKVSKFVASDSAPKVEFPAVSTPKSVNVNSNVHGSGAVSQRNDIADSCPSEGLQKNFFPEDGVHSSHIHKLQQPGSPLTGSISSLSAKRKHIFQDTTRSSRDLFYATPSPKIHDSIRKENIKLSEKISSIRKSNSKFIIVETSSLSNAIRESIENSKRQLLHYKSASSLKNYLEEPTKDVQHQHVNAPIKNLEKDLDSAVLMTEEHIDAMNLAGDGIETPKNLNGLKPNEEDRGLADDSESLDHLISFTPVNKVTQVLTAVAPTSQLSVSRIKAMEDPLMPSNSLEATSLCRSYSSPLQIKSDPRKDLQAAFITHKFVSPERLDYLLPSSMEFQDNLSDDLHKQDQCESIVNGSGLDEIFTENVATDNNFTGKVDNSDTLVVEQQNRSSTPLLRYKHLKDNTPVESIHENKGDLSREGTKASENQWNIESSSHDVDAPTNQSGRVYNDFHVNSDSAQDKGDLPREGTKAYVSVNASSNLQRSVNEPSVLKSNNIDIMQKPPQSPLHIFDSQIPTLIDPKRSPKKALSDSAIKHQTDILVRKGPFSKTHLDQHDNGGSHQGNHIHCPFPVQDIENSSKRKRGTEEIVLGHVHKISEEIFNQRRSKHHKLGGSISEQMLEHSPGGNKLTKTTVDDSRVKHWTDIAEKFSTIMNILSPSSDKLNISSLNKLEDTLVQLQRVGKYALLSSEIQSQRTSNQFVNARQKRVAETKFLLVQLVYEKAKLQIMHVKHEKLLKKRQLLTSGIQKSQNLKLNNVKHISGVAERDTHVGNVRRDTSLVNVEGKHKVDIDTVTSMKHMLETSERKIKNIVKSCNYTNIKGELSYGEIIALLNDLMKKKMLCRYIRKGLQLWEIDGLERWNGHYNLVLNYRGFICQRFIVDAGRASIMISNKVDESNINKNFPNMDACTAFSFVFALETTKKVFGSKSLAQETQISSSLLLNILNVIEEVQLARIEVKSLTQTNFSSPHVKQLDLQLSFVDFHSGRKATLILDMACLNRGVYPSEILPHQLQIPTTGARKTPTESLSADIKSAIDNLPVGYSRIIRICRLVSKMLQPSNG